MANPLHVQWTIGEQIAQQDLNHMQDRQWWRQQQLLAALFAASRYTFSGQTSGTANQKPQSGVLFGLKVTAAASLAVNVTDGEALLEDTTASGEDAPYRIGKLDQASQSLGVLQLALAAAPGTAGQSRIDLVYAQPVTAQTAWAQDQEFRPVRQSSAPNAPFVSTQVYTRTRSNVTIAVATGTAGVSPSIPSLPAGAIPLAYVRVANGDTAPSRVSDSRKWVSVVGPLHGVLAGCGLTYVSGSSLRIPKGVLAIGGELVQVSANFDFTPSAKTGSGVNLTGPGFRYVYAYRKHRDVTGGDFDVVISSVAPGADGSPSATALPGDTIAAAIGAGSWDAPMVFVGSFYIDGTNAIIAFTRTGSLVRWQAAQQLGTVTSATAASGAASAVSATQTWAALLPANSKTLIAQFQAAVSGSLGGASDNPTADGQFYLDLAKTKLLIGVQGMRANGTGGVRSAGNDGIVTGLEEALVATLDGNLYATAQASGVQSATTATATVTLKQAGYVEDLTAPA